jgi:hypothetical protein
MSYGASPAPSSELARVSDTLYNTHMPDLVVRCSRCDSELHHECHPETLEEAAIDLFMWRPESGFPKALKRRNENCDGTEDEENTAFFTEAYLYPLLGNEDARSLLARISHLFYAMGIDPDPLREKAWEVIEKKLRDQAEEEKRRADARMAYHKKMLPTSRTPLGGGVTLCGYEDFFCFDTNVRQCERGLCLELTSAQDAPKRTEPKLDATIYEGGIRAACGVCKRVHVATPEQLEGWRKEPRYQVSERGREREPPMRPEDFIRSDAVLRVLGLNRG